MSPAIIIDTHLPLDNTALNRALEFLTASHVEAPGTSSAVAALHVVACTWAPVGENVIITGPAGSGKTLIARTLAELARRQGYKIVHAGRMDRARGWVTPPEILIVDDWSGTSAGLRALLDSRSGRATVVTVETGIEPDTKTTVWPVSLQRATHIRTTSVG